MLLLLLGGAAAGMSFFVVAAAGCDGGSGGAACVDYDSQVVCCVVVGYDTQVFHPEAPPEHHAGVLLQVLAEQQQVVLPAFGEPEQGHLPLLDGKTGQPVPEAVQTEAAE